MIERVLDPHRTISGPPGLPAETDGEHLKDLRADDVRPFPPELLRQRPSALVLLARGGVVRAH